MSQTIVKKTSDYFKSKGVVLPSISQLQNPSTINDDIKSSLKKIDNNDINPLNLFRVHWYNKKDQSGFANEPEHIILPPEFTGVKAKIIVNIGRYFPLITAHKVLAAYGCLLPRILNGTFDYENQRAVWPSTGNYCRGGVAISRIMGLNSVAILPEGMSKERFEWLNNWVEDKKNIIKTKGTESNVKEIYDACNELKKDNQNDIINQFDEYYNYGIHRSVTGPSFEKSFLKVKGSSNLTPRFYVSASGSSGTLAAGDYLKEKYQTKIAVVEASECPTLLHGGYGEHNIQGIGDKHVPLIHNVMNTDFVVDISEHATNNLNMIFNTEIGKKFLINKKNFDQNFVKIFDGFFIKAAINDDKLSRERVFSLLDIIIFN